MPTDVQLKAMIVLEVNDTSGTVLAQIDVTWAMYERYASIDQMMQYNAALIKSIDLALGKIREDVSFNSSGDLAVSLSHKFAHLQIMRQNAVSELKQFTAAATAAGVPVAGLLTQTAPVMPLSGSDANDRAYKGDPYRVTN